MLLPLLFTGGRESSIIPERQTGILSKKLKKLFLFRLSETVNIFTGEDAVKMREYTGCDGIMVARGAKGNPWLFREIKAALFGEKIPERPTEEEVISMLLRHAQLSVKYKGEKMGIREMRKHTAWYTTGMHGSSSLRNKVNQVETLEALRELLMR